MPGAGISVLMTFLKFEKYQNSHRFGYQEEPFGHGLIATFCVSPIHSSTAPYGLLYRRRLSTIALATVRVDLSSQTKNRSADRVSLRGCNRTRLRRFVRLVSGCVAPTFPRVALQLILSSEIA